MLNIYCKDVHPIVFLTDKGGENTIYLLLCFYFCTCHKLASVVKTNNKQIKAETYTVLYIFFLDNSYKTYPTVEKKPTKEIPSLLHATF